MKVMIAVSGGLDSSVILHHALTDTAHDVLAIYYPEDFNARFRRVDSRQRESVDKIVERLRKDIRPFDFKIGELKHEDAAGVKFPVDHLQAIRPGFVNKRATYYHRCRAATHAHNAVTNGVDQVWTGVNTWNRRNVVHRRRPEEGPGSRRIYREYTKIPLITPFLDQGLGRLSVIRRLPKELAPLIVQCSGEEPTPCGNCRKCKVKRFYDLIVKDVSDETMLAVEERLERLGQFRRYEHLADPETYSHNDFYRHFDQIDEWRDWLVRGADPDT